MSPRASGRRNLRGANTLGGRAPGPPAAELSAGANRAVYVPSFSSDDMVERLQRAWDVEPGYSKTAIVNAVTRAAHTEEWKSWTTSEDLERAAGELLYARVWNVQIPEGAQL